MPIFDVENGLRLSHLDFAGRAKSDRFSESNEFKDCQGHSTGLESFAAGRYSGIGRNARLISVRVLDCNLIGRCTNVVKALKCTKREAR